MHTLNDISAIQAKAHCFSKKYPNPQMLLDFHKRSIHYYIKTGNKDSALQHSNAYISTIDSVMKTEKFMNASSRFEQSNEYKANMLIGDLQFKISKLKLLLYGIVLAALISVTLVIVHRRRKWLYSQLFNRNMELARIETVRPMLTDDKTEVSSNPKQPSNEELLTKIKTVISDPSNFCDLEFSLNALAKMVGSNTKYVSQAINMYMGINFRSCINDIRIREALPNTQDSTRKPRIFHTICRQ